jgi:hypothetical protein
MEAALTSGTEMRAVYEPAFERRKHFFAGLEKEKRLSLRRASSRWQEAASSPAWETRPVLENRMHAASHLRRALHSRKCSEGLASHYCDQVWGVRDSGFKRKGRHFTAFSARSRMEDTSPFTMAGSCRNA